ncbi:MAG: hypothetical protein ACLVKR_09165, partial [Lachnospiraceae bacterium]
MVMRIAVFGDGDVAITVVKSANKKGIETEVISSSDISISGITTITYDKMRGKYDAIVLTEAGDNKELAWQIAPFLKSDGFVLTLQPGSPETQLSVIIGEERIVKGIVIDDKILIEESPHAKQAVQITNGEISNIIAQKRFENMAEAAFGAISSVAGYNTEMITSNEHWLNLMMNCVREFMAICAEEKVYDIKVNGYLPADLMTMKGFFKKKYPIKKIIEAVPDYSQKTPVLEFEAICEYAKKDGIDAPICMTTLALLKKIADKKLKRGPQN